VNNFFNWHTLFNLTDLLHFQMSISGENAPAPVQSFEDAGLRTLLMENIKKSGYTKPTPIQRLSIPAAMLKRDMMNCAQTGSGKTAAFLVP
jgi:probable ATP-dependent RNA helicase DDX4